MKTTTFLLALALAATGCSKEPSLPPWTVVCDKAGHYNFTWEDGRWYNGREYADRGSAKEAMDAMRKYEGARDLAKENKADVERRRAIDERPWDVCPEPVAETKLAPNSVVLTAKNGAHQTTAGALFTSFQPLILATPKYDHLRVGTWFDLVDDSVKEDHPQSIVMADAIFQPQNCRLIVNHQPTVTAEGDHWIVTFAP